DLLLIPIKILSYFFNILSYISILLCYFKSIHYLHSCPILINSNPKSYFLTSSNKFSIDSFAAVDFIVLASKLSWLFNGRHAKTNVISLVEIASINFSSLKFSIIFFAERVIVDSYLLGFVTFRLILS